MRLFVVVLALAVAASTQAMAFGSHGRMTKKAEVNEGCPAAFYPWVRWQLCAQHQRQAARD